MEGSQHVTGGHSKAGRVHKPLLPGVYVPTVAFFNVDESVDISTTEKHAIMLARAGITGIVTHGSNGEAVHLSHDERTCITSATRRALDSIGATNVPIIVGCGAQSTRESILLCQEAAESGGDYALILPPSYYSSIVSTRLLLAHFTAIADASPIPIMIYNFPGAASGLDLDSDQIIMLSRHPNVVGVKLTCGNTGKLVRIASACKKRNQTQSLLPFVTLGGSADFLIQTLSVSGQGVIAGTANLAPKACMKIFELYKQQKYTEALEIQEIVARGDWVAIKGGFVAVKSGLQSYYGYGGPARMPCEVPTGVESERLKEEFRELMELEKKL